ncbi:MAG: hypothetical protein ABIR55_01125 [Burkholderiaceae bacterium]
MDKSDPPRSFGVFKPAGHTVLVFPDAHKLDDAAMQLAAAGILPDGGTRYTPQEMMAQTQADLEGASALASIGQELNLVKVHRELAGKGCHFLVVPTDKDELARQVAEIARACGAVAAQQYGHLVVEDLIDPAEGGNQVFESPDRGLDTKLPIPPSGT